jgi:hypothetical protein
MTFEDLMNYTIMCKKRKYVESFDEAQQIVNNNDGISCLIIYPNDNNNTYGIIESSNKHCIERSLFVFENIKKIINLYKINISETRYIFHYKNDACNIKNENIYPLLAHSRKIGVDNVILWNLTLTQNTYYHYDISKYIHNIDKTSWNDKKNIFFFRGMNSGNCFPSIKYSWNLERESRVNLLFEYLKLSSDIKNNCDISFSCLYPNTRELALMHNDTKMIKQKFNDDIKKDSNEYNLQNEIITTLQNMKPFVNFDIVQQHKFIICPEGFDVSSSLNWVLMSNSVAIVPPLHYENTIINSKILQPYVHYIPINEDYSDLEQVISWALNNDDKCKDIVINANNYAKQFLDQQYMLNYLKNILEVILK